MLYFFSGLSFYVFFFNVPVTQMQTVNEEKSDHRKEKLEEGEVTNCLRIFFSVAIGYPLKLFVFCCYSSF